MIKYLILLISFSYASTLEQCRQEASLLGDQGHDSISNTCVTLFISMATGNQVKEKDNLRVYSAPGILLFEDLSTGKITYTTGTHTQLDNITSISIDSDNLEVAVLDASKGEVSFYSSYITGNIAPIRVIKSANFIGSHDIAVGGNEVSVINGDNGQLWTYSRLANSLRRANKRADAVKTSRSDIPIGTTKLSWNEQTKNFETIVKREVASENKE